jgi:hypothetical protein
MKPLYRYDAYSEIYKAALSGSITYVASVDDEIVGFSRSLFELHFQFTRPSVFERTTCVLVGRWTPVGLSAENQLM